jgi:hypothetical protein
MKLRLQTIFHYFLVELTNVHHDKIIMNPIYEIIQDLRKENSYMMQNSKENIPQKQL